MVECEFAYNVGSIAGLTVLIDTWWNVNFPKKIAVSKSQPVLIDTWWNVNGESKLSTYA